MELNEVFKILEKQLDSINKELGFTTDKISDNTICFKGKKGLYKISYDAQATIMSFDCAYEDNGEETAYNTISRSLFDCASYEERDVKSLANEIAFELEGLFKAKKKVDLDKVKMPKAVSRAKAKNGVVSYDIDSLANRFGTVFPECKDDIRDNISKYGEFLPETYFLEHGTQKVIDTIRNGSEADRKKLFKMLNEVYEDGTNDVQDIIGVTILGAMQNDADLMFIADKYMSDYMAGPVHEINKLTAKNNSLTKKLKNPPPYKPKKAKTNSLANALTPKQQ